MYDRAHQFGSAMVSRGLEPNPDTFVGIYASNCNEVRNSQLIHVDAEKVTLGDSALSASIECLRGSRVKFPAALGDIN